MSVDALPRTLAIDGGQPLRHDPWPAYDNGDVYIHDGDIEAVIEALRRRLYFRYDIRPYAETEAGRLEAALCDYFGCRHTLACSSGTAAIALSLFALDLPPGSLIACPAFTFTATPSAILLAGHRPLLVECDQDLHLDVADLRRRLTAEVRAIVVVHMRGFASDLPSICAVAEDHGIPVIEDAVPALGVRLGERQVGTFGQFGAFSTQSDKSLNTGEGGFVTTDDPELYARAVVLSGAYEGREARHFAAAPPAIPDLPVFSMRMDEIRAALARSMLARLPGRLAAHHRNYRQVTSQLAELEKAGELALRRPVADGAFLGEALVFRLPGTGPAASAWVAAALRAEGIGARAFADPADRNVRAFWNWGFLHPDRTEAMASYPQTARYLGEAIDIPLSANLTERDCCQLVRAIGKVLAAAGRRAR